MGDVSWALNVAMFEQLTMIVRVSQLVEAAEALYSTRLVDRGMARQESSARCGWVLLMAICSAFGSGSGVGSSALTMPSPSESKSLLVTKAILKVKVRPSGSVMFVELS